MPAYFKAHKTPRLERLQAQDDSPSSLSSGDGDDFKAMQSPLAAHQPAVDLRHFSRQADPSKLNR